MDTEHWFAPMVSRAGNSISSSQLYLSTSETTPFTVEIYNNNILYTTVDIAKGAPKIVEIPSYWMMTNDPGKIFTPVPMGFQAKATHKFFSNYRFSIPNHAEIITSKGLAGLGKTFFAAMAPNTAALQYVNSTIGIVATEDNTTVTMSGYDAGVIFSDGTQSASKTVVLNKGQSYLVEVISGRTQENLAGLIGAKIESDKPVSVTNGNYNAIYTYQNTTNNDILMDQSVPVERLGNEFVVVKGNGPPNHEMESALVVATEDDTHITVNGMDTGIVLNTGKYTVLGSNYYIGQGNGHYNMSIATTKNVYVYQLLAGVATGSVYATGGFNFIPPLSCFLPSKIDEISSIDEIGNGTYNAKLNIITEQGADVSVNGIRLSGTQGPFAVVGNPNWVTYTLLGVSGNITVNSTKSVTAGIASGNGAVGYGGYFAGFSSVPVISKTGDCYSGVLLQVDDSYDQYQWYLDGNIIPGATSFSINPEIYGTGSYTCVITKTNCATKLTAPYNFTVCPPVSVSTYNIGSCNTFSVTPQFTTSTQTIVPGKTRIIAGPSKGRTFIDVATGIITYVPNTNLTSDVSDFFVYIIEGNGTPEDTEYFKVIINIKVLTVTDDTIKVCANPDGTGTFNLTNANVSTDSSNTITYFSDQGLTLPIGNYTNYTSVAGTVYANVTSVFGCSKSIRITLELAPQPILKISDFNANLCDTYFTGNISVDFSLINPQIISNYSASFTVKYYLTPAEQQSGSANFLPNNWSYATDTTVYVRVENASGCAPVFGQILFAVGTKIPLTANTVEKVICDSELTGNVTVQLNDYKNDFTADATALLSYYNTPADAQNNVNPIAGNQILNSSRTFYIRLENNSECPNWATLKLHLKSSKKSSVLKDVTICPNATTTLDAGPGFDSYVWSNGKTTSAITDVPVGNYWVDLGFNDCVYRQYVKVTAADIPQITRIEVSGSTATVFVIGGNPPYQYSLDGINFQVSNVFSNVRRGINKVYVKDAQNCINIQKEFLILNLINVITPNNDGKNDVLDYSDLKIKQNVNLKIFDRYGNNVFTSGDGKFIWDGRSQGRPLPTGTYWYILNWTEPDTQLPVSYKGWILLKNRN